MGARATPDAPWSWPGHIPSAPPLVQDNLALGAPGPSAANTVGSLQLQDGALILTSLFPPPQAASKAAQAPYKVPAAAAVAGAKHAPAPAPQTPPAPAAAAQKGDGDETDAEEVFGPAVAGPIGVAPVVAPVVAGAQAPAARLRRRRPDPELCPRSLVEPFVT